jgi:hypothetical protein
MKIIGLLDPYPEMNNAETEVIKRLQVAINRIGHKSVVIKRHKVPGRFREFYIKSDLPLEQIDLIISNHFDMPKFCDIFTYGAIWNPPQFLLDFGYEEPVENMNSWDDFLVYDSNVMLEHLKSCIKI